MATLPQIIVGTYEEFLLGYDVERSADGVFKINLNMASHAHQGSIRCVAAHRHLLASSGADEYVNIFSLVNRKEVAVLMPHVGTVTSLAFAPDGSHLISGSQDGSIVLFRCTDWTMMKVWKDAHKKANGVVGLSVHPSGKLLLSIGADHILRVWNLVKGRLAYAVNFCTRITPGNTLNLVTWSHDGSHYAISVGQVTEVYNVETAAVVYAVSCASKISCFDLSLPGILALGRDDGMLEIHNISEKQQLLEHQGHDRRVKCLQFHKHSEEEPLLVTASSEGLIRLWRWKRQRKIQRITQEAEINADCRIVCLTLMNPDDFVEKEKEVASKPPSDIPAKSKTQSQDKPSPASGKNKRKSKTAVKGQTSPNTSKNNKSKTPSTEKTNGSPTRKKTKKSPKVVQECMSPEKEIGNKSVEVLETTPGAKNRKRKKSSVVEDNVSAPSSVSKRKSGGFSVSKSKATTTPKRTSIATSKWSVT